MLKGKDSRIQNWDDLRYFLAVAAAVVVDTVAAGGAVEGVVVAAVVVVGDVNVNEGCVSLCLCVRSAAEVLFRSLLA